MCQILCFERPVCSNITVTQCSGGLEVFCVGTRKIKIKLLDHIKITHLQNFNIVIPLLENVFALGVCLSKYGRKLATVVCQIFSDVSKIFVECLTPK